LGAETRYVRGCPRRIAHLALAAVALVSLAACGGGPGAPSSGGIFSGATSLFGGSKKIAVAPIIGTTPQVAQQLGDALVVAGRERGLTIVTDGGKANYTLRGYLIATAEGKTTKISYIWDVNDASGQKVARVSGEEAVPGRAVADPWANVDAGAIRSIAGKTASQLAASMPRGSGSATAVASAADSTPTASAGPPPAPAAPKAASPKANGVVVTPVAGAPGDGTRSLTTALKKRLYAGGVKLANGTNTNVYMVKGTVSLADASGGKQSIRIDWQVLDPNGKKLGTVSQQNTIPKGSLNGPWGAIADAAAGAAATGILKLLPKSS
jgi:hypothetical protein